VKKTFYFLCLILALGACSETRLRNRKPEPPMVCDGIGPLKVQTEILMGKYKFTHSWSSTGTPLTLPSLTLEVKESTVVLQKPSDLSEDTYEIVEKRRATQY